MDEFEIWWKEYPKKLAKGDARKAWYQTAKIRPPTDRLIKALIVARSTEQWTKDGGQFIPYPATWLRQERWEDVHEVDLQGVVKGKMWWETVAGIEQKGRELGITPDDYAEQGWQQFKSAVFRLSGRNVTQISDVRDKKLESAGG